MVRTNIVIVTIVVCGLLFAICSFGQRAPIGELRRDVFAEYKKNSERHEDQNVVIKLDGNHVERRMVKWEHGKYECLSIPVEVMNISSEPITTMLRHEWYGGIAILSQLDLAIRAADEDQKLERFATAHQVGIQDKDELTTLYPGATKIIDVRLDWPGTGSNPMDPAIPRNARGKFIVRFILFFSMAGKNKFVESKEFEIEVN